MSELPKFRRIEDIQRYLDALSQDLKVTEQLVTKQQQLLAKLKSPKPEVRQLFAASFTEFDVTPVPKKGRKADKSMVAPTISKVVVPNLAKLKDQYGLLEELHAQRVTLDTVETQIAMQFPDKRQGPAYDKLVGSLTEMRRKVDVQLSKVLQYLSDIAKKHVPEVFTDYVTAICKGLEASVSFEDSQRFIYVSAHNRDVMFTEYVLLVNSVNDDGQIAPHLYIVIQWRVGYAVEVFVEHEFTPPNKLNGGHEAQSAASAVEAVQHLLTLEGFSSEIGNAPLSHSLTVNPNNMKPEDFRARTSISKIRVAEEGEQIDFTFRAGLSTEDKKVAAYQIFEDMKTLLRKKRAKLRMKITNAKATLFILDMTQGQEINVHDVKFLKERFGLSDQAVDKMARIINKEQSN